MKKSGFFTKMRLLQAMLVSATILLVMAFAPSQTTADEEWTLLASESGVNAYAKESTCSTGSVFIFKLENSTDKALAFTCTYAVKNAMAFGPKTEKFAMDAKASQEGTCNTRGQLALPNYEKKSGAIDKLVEVKITINQ